MPRRPARLACLLVCASLLLAKPCAHAAEPLARGAYQLSGATLGGGNFSLAALQGKYVLVSFFSTESAVSRKEMPLLRQFVADNAAKGFALVGVGVDTKLADLQRYEEVLLATAQTQERFPMLWRHAPGHHDNFGKLSTVPSHYVFDRRGNLLLQRQGPMQADDWDTLWTQLQAAK